MSEASAVIPVQAEIQKNKSLEGWQFLPIKDFAHTISGGTPKRGVDEYYNGDVPWIKSGDLNDGHLNQVDEYITELGLEKSSAKLFKPGTLLIALYGATIGRLSILNFEASTNQAVCGISVPDNVDVRYLFYYLLSIRQKLIDQGKGGAQPNINQQIVKETVVPLAPPEQQKRIIAKIEELFSHIDAGIEALKKAKQLLKQYRQSVLKAAVTGELTKEWREANSQGNALLNLNQSDTEIKVRRGVPQSVEKPDYIEHMEFPDNWLFVSVAELLSSGAIIDLKDGNHGEVHPKKAEFTETGLPFITATQVKDYKIDYEGAYKVSGKPLEKLKVGFAKPGDVIFTHKGTVGRVALNTEDCVLTPQTTYYRVNHEYINNEYLVYVLASPVIFFQLAKVKSQTTRDFVSITKQYSLFLPMPPLKEQEEINNVVEQKISAIEHLERELDIQLIKSEKNKQSVLAFAFSGNLMRTVA